MTLQLVEIGKKRVGIKRLHQELIFPFLPSFRLVLVVNKQWLTYFSEFLSFSNCAKRCVFRSKGNSPPPPPPAPPRQNELYTCVN